MCVIYGLNMCGDSVARQSKASSINAAVHRISCHCVKAADHREDNSIGAYSLADGFLASLERLRHVGPQS